MTQPRRPSLPKPVRDMRFTAGTGYLYEIAGEFYLVYTGETHEGWDACPSSRSGEFNNIIIAGADTAEDVVRRLLELHG